MKTSRFLIILGSFGSLFLAILPAYVINRRPMISGKVMKAVDERLDTYGRR